MQSLIHIYSCLTHTYMSCITSRLHLKIAIITCKQRSKHSSPCSELDAWKPAYQHHVIKQPSSYTLPLQGACSTLHSCCRNNNSPLQTPTQNQSLIPKTCITTEKLLLHLAFNKEVIEQEVSLAKTLEYAFISFFWHSRSQGNNLPLLFSLSSLRIFVSYLTLLSVGLKSLSKYSCPHYVQESSSRTHLHKPKLAGAIVKALL